MSGHILDGLRAKRDELVMAIGSYERKLTELKSDRDRVISVLRHHVGEVAGKDFLPHMKLSKVFKRGEIANFCVRALQQAPGGLNTRQLASMLCEAKGIDASDAVVHGTIMRATITALQTARQRRRVILLGKRPVVCVWGLPSWSGY